MSAGRFAVLLIRCYQKVLSPLMGGSCRFHPTCSEYARQAYLKHGFWRASQLAAWRLLRCQPFSAGGEDQVPPERNTRP